MPFPIILAGILGGLIGGLIGGGVAALVVGLLEWNTIVDWFERDKNKSLAKADENHYAVVIKEELKKGNVPVVQGIFDTKTEEFLEAERYEAEELDSELREKLRYKDLLVYEYADSSSYYEDTFTKRSQVASDHHYVSVCTRCNPFNGKQCTFWNLPTSKIPNCHKRPQVTSSTRSQATSYKKGDPLCNDCKHFSKHNGLCGVGRNPSMQEKANACSQKSRMGTSGTAKQFESGTGKQNNLGAGNSLCNNCRHFSRHSRLCGVGRNPSMQKQANACSQKSTK